ncbi:MAG TPA: DUF4238 domain-containing protein [Candidatus Dormibacteraeota bacterium]|nr:DUF4238 domain-containing protein [Candidatus Dormibacteraeota bacterium]
MPDSTLAPALRMLGELAKSPAPGSSAQLTFHILALGLDYVEPRVPQIQVELGLSTAEISNLTRSRSEARRIEAGGGGTVARQHTVSQSLLKRFGEVIDPRSGLQLIQFDLTRKAWEPKASRAVAFIPNFVRIDSFTTESLWKKVEDRLPAAIDAAIDGSLFTNPELASVIREAIALHISRNPYVRELHEQLFPPFFEMTVDRMAATPEAWPYCDEAYRRAKGYYPPPTQEYRRKGAEFFYARIKKVYADGFSFRFRVESHYEQTKEHFRRAGLELLRVPPGRGDEFLISDSGALAIDLARRAVGPREGVGLGTSTTVILPLGPRLLAALGPKDGIAEASESWVRTINELQVRAAHAFVFFRPGAVGTAPVSSNLVDHPDVFRSFVGVSGT